MYKKIYISEWHSIKKNMIKKQLFAPKRISLFMIISLIGLPQASYSMQGVKNVLALITPSQKSIRETNKAIDAGLKVVGAAAVGAVTGSVVAGPAGAVTGAFAYPIACAAASHKVQEDAKRAEEKRKAELAEREKFVRSDRLTQAISAPNEYGLVPVHPFEKAAFEQFENGDASLVVARRAFADRQPQEIARLKNQIHQRLLALRQEFGRPVDGPTGQFVQLSPHWEAARQTRVQNPGNNIQGGCSRLQNSEFKNIVKELQELGIVSNLFWKKSDVFEREVTEVVAHIVDSIVNAYALPASEKLEKEKANSAALQQQLDSKQSELASDARVRALLASECAGLRAERDTTRNEKQQIENDRTEKIRTIQRYENEIAGMEEVLPMIQRNTKKLEEENARMREDLALKRAQSPVRREQIASQAAEIERLKNGEEAISKLAQEKAQLEADAKRRSAEYRTKLAVTETENERLAFENAELAAQAKRRSAEFHKQIVELDTANKQLSEEKAELVEGAKIRTFKFREQVTKLEDANKQLVQENARKEEDKSELVEGAKIRTSKFREQVIKLEETNKQLAQEKENAEQIIQEQKAKNEAADNNSERILESYRDRIIKVTDQFKKSEKQNEELRVQLAAKEAENKQLVPADWYLDVNQQNKTFLAQLAVKETEKEQLAQENIRKEEEKRKLAEELEARARRRSLELRNQIAQLKADNENLAQEKEKVENELAKRPSYAAQAAKPKQPTVVSQLPELKRAAKK